MIKDKKYGAEYPCVEIEKNKYECVDFVVFMQDTGQLEVGARVLIDGEEKAIVAFTDSKIEVA